MKRLPHPFPLRRLLPHLPQQRRGLFLVAALILLLGWVIYDALFSERPAPEPPPRPTAAARTAPSGSPGPTEPSASPEANGPVDIFAVRSWSAPPAEATPAETTAGAAPPAPPEAPPLPFRYLGRLNEPGRATVFFLGDEEDHVLAVRPGDPIGPDYRVGRFREGRLEFIYRPMKAQQFLAVGSEK
jgi:hypothetical protein